MNIKDILNESATDLVANFYERTEENFDNQYNPQAAMIADMNREHYAKYFGDFEESGIPPVFEKVDNNETYPDLVNWDNHPDAAALQTPGYRGQQQALGRAGVPHANNAQKYDPNANAMDIAMNRNPV